jgi:hypothetical protein
MGSTFCAIKSSLRVALGRSGGKPRYRRFTARKIGEIANLAARLAEQDRWHSSDEDQQAAEILAQHLGHAARHAREGDWSACVDRLYRATHVGGQGTWDLYRWVLHRVGGDRQPLRSSWLTRPPYDYDVATRYRPYGRKYVRWGTLLNDRGQP